MSMGEIPDSTTYSPACVLNPAVTTYPQRKQVLNRPVFLHGKPPVPQSGAVQGYSLILPEKNLKTGRSGFPQKWRSGPAAGPDGLARGCSPPTLSIGDKKSPGPIAWIEFICSPETFSRFVHLAGIPERYCLQGQGSCITG